MCHVCTWFNKDDWNDVDLQSCVSYARVNCTRFTYVVDNAVKLSYVENDSAFKTKTFSEMWFN